MTTPPRILITNDDGVDAPGIKIMQEIAAELSNDVWVVAPADNQSGAGHRMTFGKEMELDRRERNVFALPGTPADCVVVGCTHILEDRRPDIVLSGVNLGQNLGDIIHVSGTMAGAREGALQGAIGIAMSQAIDFEHEHEVDWTNAVNYGADIVRGLMAEHQHGGTVYNVNFPMLEEGRTPDVRIVTHQRFSTSPFKYYASRNEGKFFISIPETPQPLHPEHDFHVLHHEHAITVTPLLLQQTDDETSARLEGRLSIRQTSINE